MTSRLEEIGKRCEAATAGPWTTLPLCSVVEVQGRNGGRLCDVGGVYWGQYTEQHMADAAFIAHARMDVPWLIEQLRARDAELTTLKAALAEIKAQALSPQQDYDRNGPSWTSPTTGQEYYSASYVLGKCNEIATLARTALEPSHD